MTAHLYGVPEILSAEANFAVLDSLVVTRFDARLKLSQNKSPEAVERIIGEFEHGDNYPSPELAREMRRVHPETGGTGHGDGDDSVNDSVNKGG